MGSSGFGTPILEKLNNEFQRIIWEPKFREAMLNIGLDPLEEFGVGKLEKFVKAEVPRWKKIIDDSGLEIR